MTRVPFYEGVDEVAREIVKLSTKRTIPVQREVAQYEPSVLLTISSLKSPR